MNLPNKLTTFRMILVPVLILTMLWTDLPYHFLISNIIFIIASSTDAMDGHIARKYNLITDFGKFMDPLADKLLVISALICLVPFSNLMLIPSWVAVVSIVIVVSRELTVSILRAIAAADGKVIAAGKGGKLKTISQMVGIIVLLFGLEYNTSSIIIFGDILVGISVILALTSGIEYLTKNKQIFMNSK